jgi:hypothetical protein
MPCLIDENNGKGFPTSSTNGLNIVAYLASCIAISLLVRALTTHSQRRMLRDRIWWTGKEVDQSGIDLISRFFRIWLRCKGAMHDVPDPRAERLGSFTPSERFLGKIANNRELPILFDFIMRVESIPPSIRMEGHQLIRSSDPSDPILYCYPAIDFRIFP